MKTRGLLAHHQQRNSKRSFNWQLLTVITTILVLSLLVGAFATRTAQAAFAFVADTFNRTPVGYGYNDGSLNWAGPWTETNDDGTAGNGNIRITGGELLVSSRMFNNDGDFEAIQRPIDLSSASGGSLAMLSFSFRTVNLETNDTLEVEIYNGSGWANLDTLSSSDTNGFRFYDISNYANANSAIRFRISANFDQSNEAIYFDDVKISFYTDSSHTLTDVLQTVQTYYLPLPEDQVLHALDAINADAQSPTFVYASITVVSDDTVIYYDQWEDGFEDRINDPQQSTTDVWGDNNPGNGMPPGYTTDVLKAGDIIILSNPVDTSTLSVIDFDGGDKLASTDAIAVTRASWATGTGTLHGGAEEVLDTSVWGTHFDVPMSDSVGVDFEYTGLSVMASQDDTQIYHNGSLVTTLDEGGSYLFDNSVVTGDSITSTAPIQAILLTGDIGSTYESDFFTLYPSDLLSDSYYALVNSVAQASNGDPVTTAVFLFNPDPNSAITVQWMTTGGAQTPVTVPSRGTARVNMPTTATGAHFYTNDSRVFAAFSVIDSGYRNFDWGYTLIPDNQLTQQAKVGWGPGQDPTIIPQTENGSPVWVTAVGSGTLYVCVDYDGDNQPGIADSNGYYYDTRLSLTSLQRATVYDPDGDQTGMLLYMCNGSQNNPSNKIAVAWGQDPVTASYNAPGLDVGTTVPPLPNFTAIKDAKLTNDINGDGRFDIGESFAYHILIQNSGALPIPANTIQVSDIVPDYTLYVPNSTTIDNGTTTSPISDNLSPATLFPLDEGGYLIHDILPIEGVFTVTFQVKINANLPGSTNIQNSAQVSGLDLVYEPQVDIVVQPPDENSRLGDFVWLDLNGDGVQDTGEPGIPGLPLELHNGACTLGVDCLTTVSDPTGVYTFPSLITNTYTVIVDTSGFPANLTQTYDPDGVYDDQTSVALNAGNIPYTAADFGYRGNVSIGDFVWEDYNEDGLQDPGEPGLGGVTIDLTWAGLDGVLGTSDDVFLSTTTGGAGDYNFANLPAGAYQVELDESTLPYQYTLTTSNPITLNDLPAGTDYTAADFSVVGHLSIGDTLWYDWDGDGAQDANEPGISGVDVFVDLNTNGIYDAGADLLDATDANGQYSFDDLAIGVYRLIVDTADLPAGLSQTADPDAVFDSQHTLVASAPGAYDYVDFGYRGTGSISNFVWNDLDGDGVQDAGEAGISGVTVWVDLDNDGLQDPTEPSAVTNTNGLYTIGGLPARTYVVRTSGASISGATPTYDLDGAGTPDVASVPLAAGQNRNDVDWGYQFPRLDISKSSSAGGTVNPGDTIDYTILIRNNSISQQTGIVVTDPFPSGATYVPNSSWVTVSIATTENVKDEFSTQAYNRNDGTANWATNWIENDPYGAAGPVGDYVGIDSVTQRLFLHYAWLNAERIQRSVDLSSAVNATLTFDWETVSVDASENEVIAVRVSTDGTNFTTLNTYNGTQTGSAAISLNSYLSSNTTIRFEPLNNNWENDDYAYFDNVQIEYTLANTFRDEFTDRVYNNSVGSEDWSSDFWTETNDNNNPTSGKIQITTGGELQFHGTSNTDTYAVSRRTDLSGATSAHLMFDFRSDGNLETEDTLEIRVYDGSNWTTLDTLRDDNELDSGSYNKDITSYIDANTHVSLRVTGFSSRSENLYIDNLQILFSRPSGNGTYPGGSPPDLVVASDHYSLQAGELMTVTYKVTVNDPISGGLASIDNTASVASAQQMTPQSVSTSDLLPTFIGDLVWLDMDGDGVYDVGEPGIPNVQVRLYDPGPDGVPGGGDDSLIGTAVTDANGNYVFDNQPVGDYYVQVTNASLPSGIALTTGGANPHGGFTAPASYGYMQADFGYVSSNGAILGDYVWNDADNDGVQDAGEPGLSGVELALVSDPGADGRFGTSDDVIVATTTTRSDGRYFFSGVADGKYVVVANVGPDGVPSSDDEELGGYSLTNGPQSPGLNTSTPIIVHSGDVYLEADFGYYNASLHSISDRLWYDNDGNGSQGGGEPGIPGVTVNLLNGSGQVIASAMTNFSGDFTFPGLPDGNYTLQVNDADGLLSAYTGTTANAISGSRAANLSGSDVSGVNFGYNRLGSLGDRVWSDANGDGIQDPGEPGIGGVTVELYDASGATLLRSTTTKTDGSYLFTGLSAATYVVRVAPPGGYTQTGDPDGGLDNQTSLALPVGGSLLNADFGYRNAALFSIGDTVWYDADGNGLQNDSENGIANVSLALYKDSDGDGMLDNTETVIASTTTDSGGAYGFHGLPNGDYIVVVTDQGNVLQGYQITSGLDRFPVSISGASVDNADFGYARDLETGSIGNTVWYDTDGNGAYATTERGVANVLVNLYQDLDHDGVAETLVGSAYTDVGGNYRFSGLQAGFYAAQVDASNFNPGEALYGQASTSGGDTHGLIAMAEGEEYLLADFGYRGGGFSIGDYVWSDADVDGLQDPEEPGLPGVLVELLDGNGNPTGVTTTTGPDGYYLFSGLAAGSYKVRVAASNFNPGNPLEGFSFSVGPQCVGSSNHTSNTITFVSSPPTDPPTKVDVDFGYYKTSGLGSIGDLVWLDRDLDGVWDYTPGPDYEPGLANVTVDLYRDANGDGVLDPGEPVLATTTTDANGNYTFAGLDLDDGDGDFDYIVQVSDRNNILAGMEPTVDINPLNTNPRPVALSSSNPNPDNVDFGFDDPDIGDFIWHDSNQNGIQDAGESGIQGVEVLLYADINGDGVIDPGEDNLIRASTSGPGGYYFFSGLPFQSFIIKVADSNFASGGVLESFNISPQYQDGGDPLSGVDSNGDSNNEIEITPLTTKDFSLDYGFYAPIGYSIGDLIWEDANRDGHKDVTESGVEGVSINLFRDLNRDGVLDPNEPLIGSAITSSAGSYSFTNLPNGAYIVQVNDLFRRLVDYTWIDGIDDTNDYSQLPTYAVNISNGNVICADSGYYKPPLGPTAVTMGDYAAISGIGQIIIRWQTVLELDALGFNIYRATDPDGIREIINPEMIPSKAFGGLIGADYEFIDRDVQTGVTYYYWLEFIDLDGKQTFGPMQATSNFGVYLPLVER